MTLIVDTSDIRSIIAILPNGAEFGTLTAQGTWGRSPHTLEMRKAVLALRRKKLIYYTEYDDPIQIYVDYLGSRALQNKTARRKFVATQSTQKSKNIIKNKSDGVKPESKSKITSKKKSSVKQTTEKKSTKILPKLKTFTY
jgi:putative transposase